MWKLIIKFNEAYMERLNNFVCSTVVTAVGFRVASIADENTFKRARTNFVIVWYIVKNKSTSSNFMQMREVGLIAKERFERSTVMESAHRCTNKKISSSLSKLILSIIRRTTR